MAKRRKRTTAPTASPEVPSAPDAEEREAESWIDEVPFVNDEARRLAEELYEEYGDALRPHIDGRGYVTVPIVTWAAERLPTGQPPRLPGTGKKNASFRARFGGKG